jgi:hypothetical protein
VVELVEYVIVFAVSAGVAGACVMLVQGAVPGLEQVAAVSRSDQLADAARLSVLEGKNVTLLMPLQDASVSCAGGSLSVSDGGGSNGYQVGYPCSFDYRGLNGTCTLVFSAPASSLLLEATC